MKKLFFVTLIGLMTLVSFAEIPLSNLPVYTGGQVGTSDTVPFVHFGAPNITGQVKLSEFFLIPSLQSPTFTGTLTVPTIVFTNVTGTGTLTTPTLTFTKVITGPTATFSIIVSAPSGSFATQTSAPTGVFTTALISPSASFSTGMVTPTGTFTKGIDLSTQSTAASTCGSLAGAAGCIRIKINGTFRNFPYF